MTTPDQLPPEIQAEINATKALFEAELLNDEPTTVDPHYDRIINTLIQVSEGLEEENNTINSFLFDHAEFVDALDHVVSDQLSAIKKEKITMPEWSDRFNRWFIFCDTVINLGISCTYSKDALKTHDHATIFKTLKLNKNFETTFLTPRKIRIEFTHKSKQVKDKYPWLAMPCLIVKDEAGQEYQIAITPTPIGRVWWLDILLSFHGSYDWITDHPEVNDPDGEEYEPTPTIDDPYMTYQMKKDEEE